MGRVKLFIGRLKLSPMTSNKSTGGSRIVKEEVRGKECKRKERCRISRTNKKIEIDTRQDVSPWLQEVSALQEMETTTPIVYYADGRGLARITVITSPMNIHSPPSYFRTSADTLASRLPNAPR